MSAKATGVHQAFIMTWPIVLSYNAYFEYPLSLFAPVSGQSDSSSTSVVVAGYNVSALAGSRVVLQCMSGRMVWTRDGVKDRQRVVHWDMYRAYPDYAMERVLDMFSAGDQRVYNSYNMGRVTLSPTAFRDGNFSLVIKGNSGHLMLFCFLFFELLDF